MRNLESIDNATVPVERKGCNTNLKLKYRWMIYDMSICWSDTNDRG